MSFFKIEEVDRGIEWALRDQAIARGLEVDLRAFIISGDESGYEAAAAALEPRVEVFGVGAYKDRKQLKENNIIIDMLDIEDGDIGFTPAEHFYPNTLTSDFNVKTVSDGTYDQLYEVRVFSTNVALDRELNMIVINALGRGRYIDGIADTALTPTEDQFFIARVGTPANLSSNKFIERVYRFVAKDLELEEEILRESNIAAITEINISATPQIDQVDQDPSQWDTDPNTTTVKIFAETFDDTFDDTFG